MTSPSAVGSGPAVRPGLSWLDYGVGVVALILSSLGLVVPLMLGPVLEQQFETAGVELPGLTRLALTPWLLVLISMPALVMEMIGVFSSVLETRPRRILLLVALLLALALDAGLWYALTLPSGGSA